MNSAQRDNEHDNLHIDRLQQQHGDDRNEAESPIAERPWEKRGGYMKFLHQQSLMLNEENNLKQENVEWKLKTFKLLHSHPVTLTLAVLLFIDILFMIITLALESFYPTCPIIKNSCTCEANNQLGSGRLAQEQNRGLIDSGSPSSGCIVSCIHQPQVVHDAILALGIISLIILFLFLIELVVMLAVIGFKAFFKNIFMVFDFIIVSVSIGFEIFLISQESGEVENSATESTTAVSLAIILFARSWRLMRISHGAYKEAHDYFEEEVGKLKKEIKSLKNELADLRALQQQ